MTSFLCRGSKIILEGKEKMRLLLFLIFVALVNTKFAGFKRSYVGCQIISQTPYIEMQWLIANKTISVGVVSKSRYIGFGFLTPKTHKNECPMSNYGNGAYGWRVLS
jgi:hypothetical protein